MTLSDIERRNAMAAKFFQLISVIIRSYRVTYRCTKLDMVTGEAAYFYWVSHAPSQGQRHRYLRPHGFT